MRDDCPTARNIIDRQERVLRLAEKRGLTIAVLAAETQIPPETLRSYCDKPSRPASMMPLSAFVKLARVLPPDLSSLLIEDSGYLLTPIVAQEKQWLDFAARANDIAGKVCRFKGSGKGIDHREDAELTDDARSLAAMAAGMAIQ